jgi:hypothetical protein
MPVPDAEAELNRLFPVPYEAAFASPAAPKPQPGITPESTSKLKELLIKNHKQFHTYFGEKVR